MGTRGCGLLDVQYVVFCQLSMVTETEEGRPPVHVTADLSN